MFYLTVLLYNQHTTLQGTAKIAELNYFTRIVALERLSGSNF